MHANPNGRLAVYANHNGEFYGHRLVDELNKIIDAENKKSLAYLVDFVPQMKDLFADNETVDITVNKIYTSMNRLMTIEPKIALKKPLVEVFPNSMLKVSIADKVSGEDAVVVQWFPQPPGTKNPELNAQRNKAEFFHTIAALLQARVKKLTLVTPYAFDQRKDVLEGRDTIGAALFCQELVDITKSTRIQAFCLDIHAQQIVGFYQLINVQMVSVPMFRTYVDFIKEFYPEIFENAVIVLPDVGASKRGRTYSELTKLPRITVDKRRVSPTEVVLEAFSAGDMDLKGKNGLLVDDIISSGDSAGKASEHLKKKGVVKFYWLMTHPELTDMKKLDELYGEKVFEKIFLADTVELPEREYFVQVPTAKLMARLIYNVHTDQSIGSYLGAK